MPHSAVARVMSASFKGLFDDLPWMNIEDDSKDSLPLSQLRRMEFDFCHLEVSISGNLL